MQLVAPDILAEAAGLSPLLCLLGLVLGGMLWSHGWRAHRFWVVLLITVLAGIHGLSQASDYGSQPVLAGILLAVAAGMLALSLVRVLAFAAGGLAFSLLVQSVAPALHEPLVCFLVGGMLGLLLFRVWIMALTGLAGSVLACYSILCLVQRLGKMNVADWSAKHAVLLNWICGGLTMLALVSQVLLERRRARKQRKVEEAAAKLQRKKDRESEDESPSSSKARWWPWARKVSRKAG